MDQSKRVPISTIVTTDSPDLLVQQAKMLASTLRSSEDPVTRTQIRRLFTTMRQIEMKWPKDETGREQERDAAYRELVLFRPRLAYQVSRHKELAQLVKVLDEGITAVGKDRQKLQRLVQFFEATLAYWLAGQKGGSQ